MPDTWRFSAALAGALPGSVFTFPVVPSQVLALVANQLELQRVDAAPGPGQYMRSGATVTTGDTFPAGSRLWADYLAPGIPVVRNRDRPVRLGA